MSEGPKRIQLSRAKGWRMPHNTVKVDRTTRWGNPYRIERDDEGPLIIDANGRLMNFLGAWSEDRTTWANAHARGVELFRQHAAGLDVSELRGKNLACSCKPDAACHADVLLEIANG